MPFTEEPVFEAFVVEARRCDHPSGSGPWRPVDTDVTLGRASVKSERYRQRNPSRGGLNKCEYRVRRYVPEVCE